MNRIILLLLVFSFSITPVYGDDTNADLVAKLEYLQKQIDELKKELAQTRDQSAETDAKVEAVADVIDSQRTAPASGDTTKIGGYGELHYTRLEANNAAHDVDEIDFHRFVLLFGHQFNDRTRFYSELELEHAFIANEDDESTPGEVELEQAFVEYDLRRNLHAKAGVFLLPVGILNETHEPTTFYGVERNDVENIIIPSTWWEAGAALNGRWGADWGWDLAFTSGLQIPTGGDDAFRVRSGRQKAAEANARNGAATGRLRYLGIPGLVAALSLQYQFDPSQQGNDGLSHGTLLEGHIDYRHAAFGLRALYARWDFAGPAVRAVGADRQSGWYLEPSYRINPRLGFYGRYENLDAVREQDQFDQWELGLNWWLNDNVVFKLDYRKRDHDLASMRGRNFKAVDVGVGYSF